MKPALLLAGLMFAGPAAAYIDPGSGSLLLQLLMAAAVGAMFKLRAVIETIKAWFKKPR